MADSSLSRDRHKADIYAAAGVTEYWIVDVTNRVVEVHRQPQYNGYEATQQYERDTAITLAFASHATVRVGDIFGRSC